MFSAGNITEKMRVGQLAKSTAGSEEVLVDLYAGIGYFVFPYLIHGGIRRAYACEWNPHSLSGLQEGCQLNNLPYATIPVDSRNCENANGGESGPLIPNDVRVIICPGDNRQWARLLATVGATRVNLGLLPDAHQGIPVAAAALSWLPIGQRGFMHIHENVRQGEEDRWAAGLLQLVERELSSMNSSNNSSNTNNSNLTGKWAVQERGRECVKSYCKSVYHWVLDVECVKMGDN
jgi:tRNA G37 N-methylase Trm5